MTPRHFLRRDYRFRKLHSIEQTITSLSLTGKLVFWTLALLFTGSALAMLLEINSAFLVSIPAHGGTLTEGVVGLPRFTNPVLAVTDGDKDLSALIYSGLMRYTPSGKLVQDLAESYTISPDGKVYTFKLRKDALFHDNTPVTADDIEFTISKIQDPNIKSESFSDWQGIIFQKTDDYEVKFFLKEPYAPFIGNTTLGILPKHLWQNVSSDQFPSSNLNIKPIGSGPYLVASVKDTFEGPHGMYVLKPFKKHMPLVPLIDRLVISFYTNEKDLVIAYENGEIDSMNGISPHTASDLGYTNAPISQMALPRIFGVFFNQSENPALSELDVRKALDEAVNREYIVNTVLQGYGTVLTEPVPQDFVENKSRSASTTILNYEDSVAAANTLLDKAGWKLNADGIREKKNPKQKDPEMLQFSITTSDAPELREVAGILKDEWRKIGADVTVKVFEGGYLNQNIIKPRHYEALLFGQVVNRDLDLYPFWHSGELHDPGLNIALYNNPKADVLLNEMRVLSDKTDRIADYEKFKALVAGDVPAVFLYSPRFIYVTPKQVKNISTGPITTPSDRFNGISNWYIEVNNVWKLFIR